MAAVSLTAAFVNTLFTQTANFAAKDFGISEGGQSVAGVIVRCGIVIALPFTILADRVGRRRMIVLLAWLAPLCASLGALAPNFWVLTATQTIARPLGIALDLLIAVAAAEEMPRNSRAYAVSVLAMASGLGAGVAVMALPLADLHVADWRLVYLVSLVWLFVAWDVSRRLTETPRFEHVVETHQIGRTHIDRRRFVIIASVAFIANLFIAPASFFQNRYLDDVRGYSSTGITLFTITTATPGVAGVRARRAPGRHARPPPRAGSVAAARHRCAGRLVHRRALADVAGRVPGWPDRRHGVPGVLGVPQRAVPDGSARTDQRHHRRDGTGRRQHRADHRRASCWTAAGATGR